MKRTGKVLITAAVAAGVLALSASTAATPTAAIRAFLVCFI